MFSFVYKLYGVLISFSFQKVLVDSFNIPEFIATGYCSTPELPLDFDPVKVIFKYFFKSNFCSLS